MTTRSEKERQKAQQEKFQAILSNLLKDEDNKYCVDCDAKGLTIFFPSWWLLFLFTVSLLSVWRILVFPKKHFHAITHGSLHLLNLESVLSKVSHQKQGKVALYQTGLD